MSDTEDQNLIFSQDGVMLKQADASYITFVNTIGTLCICESKNDTKEKCLEWRPNDVTVDSDLQDQEWAVVNTSQKRTRTISGSLPPDYNLRLKNLRILFKDIRSIKLGLKNREMHLYNGKGDIICKFLFQTNSNVLFGNMKLYLKIIPAKRDKNLYYVEDTSNQEVQLLETSFGTLNMNDEPALWRMARNFHQQPYEATMDAFAKITNLVYKKEFDREALSRSMSEYSTNNVPDFSSNPTNDYEVVGNPPRFPARKEFPRTVMLTQELWADHRDFEGRIVDVQSLKNEIFRGGVSPAIRKEVWKYLLDYYPWNSTHKEREALVAASRKEYFAMKLQWQTFSAVQEENFSDYRERKSLIEKDVNRTDRNLEFYAGDDNTNLTTLYEILMTYIMYNFDLGYVQGMSDLLSPILLLLNDEVEAFWCFVGFMKKLGSNFDMDQACMKEQFKKLHELLTFYAPDLAAYLNEHESANMFFAFRWLLVWFKREFDEDDVMRFWEILWTGLPCDNFHLVCAVAILDTEKQALMNNGYAFTDIIKHINELSGRLCVDSILNKAEGIYYQMKESEFLTDNIRVILGIPIPPPPTDSNPESNSSSTQEISTDDVRSNGSAPLCSVDNVRISPDEGTYERSISANFL